MFKPYKSRRVRYIVPPLEEGPGHQRGIKGLAYDSRRNISYTGGCDGVIAAWDASWTTQDASANPSSTDFPLIKRVQAHSDWIHDLCLVDSGNGLVTASKDSSVKLWRPHDSAFSEPTALGAHLDFVNCVAAPSETSSWIVSGGVDNRVIVWDLPAGRESLHFKLHEDNTSSHMVWALNAAQRMVIAGGNDKIVRTFDPRTGKQTRELVGHTDIVRGLLVSDDEELLMSCSSDKTIKLWSTSAGRCISTLSLHDASIFALWSDHPSLSCFYSGDRQGTVIKTDCRGFSGGGIEQAVSYTLLRESSAISRLQVCNGRVWTGTQDHNVNVWKDLDVIPGKIAIETLPSKSTGSRNRGVSISVSGASGEVINIPANCVVRMGNLQGAMPTGGRNKSRMSTHHSVATRKSGVSGPEFDRRNLEPLRTKPERTVRGRVGLKKAVLLNDKRRVVASDTANSVHLWDILECRYLRSLGSHLLEKAAAALNTQDVVPNWCSIATDTGSLACTIDEKRAFDAETYVDQIEFARNRGIPPDTRINIGAWMLRTLFDDLVTEERSRDAQFREQLSRAGTANATTADLAILVPQSRHDAPTSGAATPHAQNQPLASPGVFAIGAATPSVLTSTATGTKAGDQETSHSATNGALDDATNRAQQSGDYFSAKPVEEGTDTASNASQADGSEASRNSSSKDASSTTFSQRFKTAFSTKKLKAGLASPGPSKIAQTEEKADEVDVVDEAPEAEEINREKLLAHVLRDIREEYVATLKQSAAPECLFRPALPEEALKLNISRRTMVIIQEHDHCTEKSQAVTDVFQGKQVDLGKSASAIEQAAPYWVGALLFKNERSQKDQVKVPFLLKAFDDSLPQVTLHDGDERLTANRIIRLRKAVDYILDRLEPVEDTEETRTLRPDECIELWCQDKLVDLNFTLAQLKTHVWKSGGDVLLRYKMTGKRKFHPTRVRDAYATKTDQ